MNKAKPLSQENRPPCSLPLTDADLSLNNSNWTKGLQAMSDWIWSANLNPSAFPNNLARYFLQIPGIFEQQLNFSTSLIFDEPSFKNGVQISGFVNRLHKELVISLIAHTRRAWYTMTHHAILGKLTADKHGVDTETYANKIYYLSEYSKNTQYYTPLELKLFDFAYAFATDPKSYSEQQCEELKEEFRKYNEENYQKIDYWLLRKEAVNFARTEALAKNISFDSRQFNEILNKYLSQMPDKISDELNNRKTNAQMVELSFLCLQFVALACVFSGLNIPDEAFLSDVMMQLLPAKVIEKINELNELGLNAQTPPLVPPPLGENNNNIDKESDLFKAIIRGHVKVKPARLKGARIALTPYEGKDENGSFRPAFLGMPDKDKGLTVGGVQVGVYGWSFGGHFPGSLVYCLMNHPELARFEAPYSLPLLFNEDEWRNGVQTAGYVSRKLKELVIQKVYKINRSRYGLEHHTMFLYNSILDEYGVGRISNPSFSPQEVADTRLKALEQAEKITLYIHDHKNAPLGVFSPLEEEVLTWTEALLNKPHKASEKESQVRDLFRQNNEIEVKLGLRVLDLSPGIGKEAAMNRLIDHQIAELAMMIGHMDGLGRLLTILRLEAEEAVQTVEGEYTDKGGIKPNLDADGQVKFTGYFNNRFALHDILSFIGVSEKVQTLNELFVNPALCEEISRELEKDPNKRIEISSAEKGSPEF